MFTKKLFIVNEEKVKMCKQWEYTPLSMKLVSCFAVDFTSVDTRNSERETATFNRMHEITSAYQRSSIYQSMLEKVEQNLQQTDKPAIPFKSKESPNGAAKLEVLLRSAPSSSSSCELKLYCYFHMLAEVFCITD